MALRSTETGLRRAGICQVDKDATLNNTRLRRGILMTNLFEFYEYHLDPYETGETITEVMTKDGWEVWMTTKFVDGDLKTITFRRRAV